MMEMATLLFLGFIIAQRLSELVVAKRNTACLLDKGAYEVGAEHYLIMVGKHSLWIAGLLFLGYDEGVAYGWIAIFAVLLAAIPSLFGGGKCLGAVGVAWLPDQCAQQCDPPFDLGAWQGGWGASCGTPKGKRSQRLRHGCAHWSGLRIDGTDHCVGIRVHYANQ